MNNSFWECVALKMSDTTNNEFESDLDNFLDGLKNNYVIDYSESSIQFIEKGAIRSINIRKYKYSKDQIGVSLYFLSGERRVETNLTCYFVSSLSSNEVLNKIHNIFSPNKRNIDKINKQNIEQIGKLSERISELESAVYYAPALGNGYHIAKKSFDENSK